MNPVVMLNEALQTAFDTLICEFVEVDRMCSYAQDVLTSGIMVDNRKAYQASIGWSLSVGSTAMRLSQQWLGDFAYLNDMWEARAQRNVAEAT